MNTTTPPRFPVAASTGRALVLGGGGSVGNAWLIGVAAGLADTGVNLADAELIIGTSAGATAAAQLTSETPAALLAGILSSDAPRSREHAAPAGARHAVSLANHMETTDRIIASARDAADMRRRMGAAALELDAASGGSDSARWRSTVAGRLKHHDWPDRAVLITAIDAETGEGVAFDRDSGVGLVEAIAASTSNGFGNPPYRIGSRCYLDGGYRRNENADLAAGYGRVLTLSPFGGRSRHPREWGMQLSAQLDELRAGGSRVEAIFPDPASLEAFGPNMMDLSRRVPAARAGFEQGRALAASLAEFWASALSG